MILKLKTYYKIILLIIVVLISFKLCQYYFISNEIQIIPRKVIFDNPEYCNVKISPNGKWLSYLANNNGQLNIWIKDLTTNKIRALTNYSDRCVQSHYWAYDNQHILYLKDLNGDENWQLYKLNIESGNSTLLTSEKGVQARILRFSTHHPSKVLIGINERDPVFHDVYLLDIKTGKKLLLLKNSEYMDFLFDDNFKIIFAQKYNIHGDVLYFQLFNKNDRKLYRKVSLIDSQSTTPLDLDQTGNWIYWLDSEGTDKSNLIKMNLHTKEKQLLRKGNKSDVSNVWIHSVTKEVLSTEENYLRRQLIPYSQSIMEDYNILKRNDKGEFSIISDTLDNTKWVVVYWDDMQPSRYYLYDRITKKPQFLFFNKSSLKNLPLVEMQSIEIKTRDNLTMVCYLSLPKNKRKNTPVPMVLVVHGGPIGIRDEWGYSHYHQWLANRGYAVLSVNYRGSGGFGKHFIKAAYGEWGRKMHEDLIDALNWAVQENIAISNKIAIYGGSYGGYSALVGATMTPDIFACALAYVGISNLVTFSESIPPYWEVYRKWMKFELGDDTTTSRGKEFLLSRSPISYINNIKKPLLIAHGANDARVKKSESDQIVNAMQKKGIPVTYVLFPDEGHGFINPKNKLANIAINEAFLHQTLGGAFEPITNEIKNSSAQILAGNLSV